MALTVEQKIARTTKKINRLNAEIRRVERQKSSGERTKRNHRLIEAAATVEAVAKRYGFDDFEFDKNNADWIASYFFKHYRGGKGNGHGA